MEEVTPENELTYRVDEKLNGEPPPPKSPKVASKKNAKKKATVKRKATTAKSKRRKPAARQDVSPPVPLTLEELKEQGREAKQELINAVVEPAVEVVGSLSQTVRDTIGGAFAGLLSRKRRD